MVTPLADALMDAIPMVVFTGQVPTHLIGSDAFQEADTVGITRSCTKHNYLVRDVNDLARTIHEAFYVATHGRPGPVLVDIPKNVQFAKGNYVGPEAIEHRTYHPRTEPQDKRIEEALALMAGAQRPIIYSGGGVINSGPEASQALRALAKATGWPVTSTLMGLGAFPASSPQWLGMVGMHGSFDPTTLCTIAMSCCASARASMTGSPVASTRSRPARRRSTSTSTRPRSTRTSAPIFQSWPIAARL
jgi:acetolactate synthase-1/2/3 large subunit